MSRLYPQKTCPGCRKRRSVRRFRKYRKVCMDCEARQRREQRANEPRRLCPECNVVKREALFYHWKDSRNGNQRSTRVCKACTRRRQRERYRRVMADPYLAKHEREMNSARQKRYYAENPERNNARCRRWREKVKRTDPKRYQQMLEDSRIRSRLAKNREDTMPVGVRVKVKEPRGNYLPVEPLIEFLNSLPVRTLREHERELRSTYRVLHESRAGVTVKVADSVVTAYNGALANVYPELYA